MTVQAQTTRRGVLVGAAATGGLAAGTAAAAAAPGRHKGRPRHDRPNVIVVSIDDLGWDELGCYGNTFNETPHIDRLAREGTRFTNAYAAAPLCSPTRAALVTGLYPGRTGVTDFLRPEAATSDNFLPTGLRTVPEVLRSRGYTSGLIGKWHLTETYSGAYDERPGNPYAHGFDDVRASEQLYIGDGDYFHPYFFMPTLPARTPGEHLTDRLADEAVDFVTRHRREPFFLHLSNYAVHTALDGKPDLVAKYAAKPGADQAPNRPVLAAMLESIDDQVGRIVETLHRLHIADDTLLLLTSDNGGPYRDANQPLRGGKGELYEGGIRVPLVAYWRGHVRRGRVDDTLTSTIDVLPTALDLAGGKPREEDFDGVSIASALTGRGRPVRRDTLFWAYPHHIGKTHPHAAVRSGRHKLVLHLRDGRSELYDLDADQAETTDLSAIDPATTARLRALLEAHLAELDLYPGPPTEATHPTSEIDEPFDTDLASYAVVPVPSGSFAGQATVADGQLKVTTTEATHLLAISSVAPASGEVAVTLDPGGFANSGTQETVFVGLAKDGDNYVLLRYRHDLHRVGLGPALRRQAHHQRRRATRQPRRLGRPRRPGRALQLRAPRHPRHGVRRAGRGLGVPLPVRRGWGHRPRATRPFGRSTATPSGRGSTRASCPSTGSPPGSRSLRVPAGHPPPDRYARPATVSTTRRPS